MAVCRRAQMRWGAWPLWALSSTLKSSRRVPTVPKWTVKPGSLWCQTTFLFGSGSFIETSLYLYFILELMLLQVHDDNKRPLENFHDVVYWVHSFMRSSQPIHAFPASIRESEVFQEFIGLHPGGPTKTDHIRTPKQNWPRHARCRATVGSWRWRWSPDVDATSDWRWQHKKLTVSFHHFSKYFHSLLASLQGWICWRG